MIQGLGHRHALGGIFVQEPQNEIDCWAISTNAEVEKKRELTLLAHVSLLQQGHIRWLSKTGSNPLLNI